MQLLAPTGTVAWHAPREMDVVLTESQQAVHDALHRGRNSIVIGPAGTGKTYIIGALLHTLAQEVMEEGKSLRVVSDTIAKYLQLRPGLSVGEQRAKLKGVRDTLALVRTRVMIIDEFSMVPASDMGHLDVVLRRVLDSEKPFGDMQIIMIGDDYQLGSISKDPFVGSPLYNEAKFSTFHLDQVLRQDDTDDNSDFCSFLWGLRRTQDGKRLSVADECYLDYMLYRSPRGDDWIGACATRAEVKKINEKRVARHEGPRYMIGNVLEDYLNDPRGTVLHPGAPIQISHNVYEDGKLVHYNGELGTFVDFIDPETSPVVHGVPYELVSANTSVIVDIGGKVCTIHPVNKVAPIDCAYATTIHRLQGQTIRKPKGIYVNLDGVDKEEALRLAYVAFTRAEHGSQVSTNVSSDQLAAYC